MLGIGLIPFVIGSIAGFGPFLHYFFVISPIKMTKERKGKKAALLG